MRQRVWPLLGDRKRASCICAVFAMVCAPSFPSGGAETKTSLNAHLSDAARNGQRAEVIRLIQAGANVNTKDTREPTDDDDISEATALSYAAFYDDIELVKWLLSHGANPNSVDQKGSPLTSAIRSGDIEIVTLLLNSGSRLQTSQQKDDAIILAASGDHTDLVDLLLKLGASINAVGSVRDSSQPTSLLSRACEKSGPALVKHLIDLGANVNAEPSLRSRTGSTPLMSATSAGKVASMELLLAHGADVNKRSYDFMAGDNVMPLEVAVSNRNLDAIKLLAAAKPNVSSFKEALARARNNWNGVKPEDADIIGILETASEGTP
jgi:ankyrin repeat protein